MKISAPALAVGAALIAGAAALAGVAIALYPSGGGRVATQPSSVGGPFELVDQNGRTVTEANFRGKPFLVFFGFTHCPDICPTALFEMSEVLNRLGPDAQKMSALFISVDPERDTPDKLKDYISSFHRGILGLTGTRAQVDGAVKAYRAYAKKVPLDGGDYTMDHSAIVYLMDRNGNFVAPFNLKKSADAAADDLRPYL